jgi:3-methyladenine DNA glycosylase AlkD
MPASVLTAGDVSAVLRLLADEKRATVLRRFFKTGHGEYAEGDRFLGVTVPEQRSVARRFPDLPLPELCKLLRSAVHEERLTALLIMVAQYRRGNAARRERLHRAYLRHTRFINNWDLVDCSAEHVVGPHIARRPRPLLRRLARSPLVWERRIALLATFHFIKNGHAGETLWLARQLLRDGHDLIHKAAGWMLREVGKRVGQKPLRLFLDRHARAMPRTMLRYAVERLPAATKKEYLNRRRAPRGPRRQCQKTAHAR